MNSKMTTNSQLSTTEPKKQTQKLSKQLEQEQNHRNEDHMEGYQWGGGGGEWGAKVGEVKNSTGNGEAKEVICTTHGHELRREGMLVGVECSEERDKGEKNIGTTITT